MKVRISPIGCGVAWLAFWRTAFGQGVISTNAQQSTATQLPGDFWRNHISTPGVLSSRPFLAALVCVVLFCLVRAGMSYKKQNLRTARNWLLAAVVFAAVCGLVDLIVALFGLP